MTFVIVMGFHQIIVVMNDVKRHTYIHTVQIWGKCLYLEIQILHYDVTISSTDGLWISQTISNRRLAFCPFGTIYNKTLARKCLCDVVNNMEKGVAECYSNQLYLFPNRWIPPGPATVKNIIKSSHICPVGYCNKCNTRNTSIYCYYDHDLQCHHSRNQKS